MTWQASGKNVVVAGRTGSAEAGLEIFKAGGNAADAAVATLLALNVTDSDEFNFGSELAVLVYDTKRGVVEALSGLGGAPALATQEYFEKTGGTKDGSIQAMAVPAPLDAYVTLLDRYGTMRFAQVAAPALRILDRYEKDPLFADIALKKSLSDKYTRIAMKLGLADRDVYNGDWHADLARTLRRLIEAEKGAKDRKRGLRLVADYFYRGPIAKEIDAWSRANGGLIRYGDLARHITRVEEPVKTNYRGYTIYKCNTWTQGPYLLQTLKLLEGYDLKSMGFQSADTIHLCVEAMKLGLADRDVYYGDPLFADIPLKELLSDKYTRMRQKLIDIRHASMVQRPGDPVAGKPLLDEMRTREGLKSVPEHDTTNCLTADQCGNVVAVTNGGPLRNS